MTLTHLGTGGTPGAQDVNPDPPGNTSMSGSAVRVPRVVPGNLLTSMAGHPTGRDGDARSAERFVRRLRLDTVPSLDKRLGPRIDTGGGHGSLSVDALHSTELSYHSVIGGRGAMGVAINSSHQISCSESTICAVSGIANFNAFATGANARRRRSASSDRLTTGIPSHERPIFLAGLPGVTGTKRSTTPPALRRFISKTPTPAFDSHWAEVHPVESCRQEKAAGIRIAEPASRNDQLRGAGPRA